MAVRTKLRRPLGDPLRYEGRMRTLALLVLLTLAAPTAWGTETVRIAVGRFRETVTISGPGLELKNEAGQVLAKGGPVALSLSSTGIRLGGHQLTDAVLHVRGASMLTLRGHRYREHLEVSWRSYRGRPELLVVHPLPIETYVLGVVSSELPSSWPLEALKAQAIAARTYAVWQKYRRLDLPYHMESSVLDQVYHGAERERPLARRAIVETYGLVLTSHRRPVQAYFHAACGGHTESAKEGWGTALPYLPGSVCGFCKNANRYRWKTSISQHDVDKAFRQVLGEPVREISILARTKTGRIKKARLVGKKKKKVITGADLRRHLGYTKLWSTWVTQIQKTRKGFSFQGRGSGHGVGMCQWGARGMAEAGHPVAEILQRYYPGAELQRMY